MPATRGKNLRSGDIAEQLGLLLLQSIALVAPVPRTEDVGIDAVATLLRDFDSYSYIAEDTFFVQIKSSSVQKIEFDKKQINWLNALELPFFIASINRANSQIDLFCAHRLSNAFITNADRDELIIHLDDKNISNELVEKDEVDVHIGPPILSWTLNSITLNTTFYEETYRIIKEHIKIYKNNLETRRVCVVDLLFWKTNGIPKVYGQASTSPTKDNETLNSAYELMIPYFVKWTQELFFAKDFSHANDVIKLLDITKKGIEDRIEREKDSEGEI